MLLMWLWPLAVLWWCGHTVSSNIPDEQALMSRILSNYDSGSRPVYNGSQSVQVKFGMSFIQLCDMEWTDERLVWNQTEYSNLDKIRIPCNRLWLPDLVLYNSADDYTQGYMEAKSIVSSDGGIFWSPPAKLRSICRIDVTFFPFDDQVCVLKFGSWTYSGLQLDLVNRSGEADLSNYMKSGEWDLHRIVSIRNTITYPCCPDEPYPDVTFHIHIRRRILYYLINIMVPCILLSLISVMTFWLPPDSGEKITLSITVLLAYSVFMLLIAENIPATSEMVPLIGIYLTFTMSMTFFSIVLTVFVLQLHHATQFAPRMSRRVYNLFTKRIAPSFGMVNVVARFEKSQAELVAKKVRERSLSIRSLNSRLEPLYSRREVIGTLIKNKRRRIGRVDSLPFSDSEYSPIYNKRNVDFSSPGTCQILLTEQATTRSIADVGRHSSFEMLPPPLLSPPPVSTAEPDFTEDIGYITNEWKLIALIVDRFLFWLFTSLTFIASLFLLLVLPILKNIELIKPSSFVIGNTQ